VPNCSFTPPFWGKPRINVKGGENTSSCEFIAVQSIGEVLHVVEGRSARLCYEDGQSVLRLYKDGQLRFSQSYPLMAWDATREMGATWIQTGRTPPQVAEDRRRAGF